MTKQLSKKIYCSVCQEITDHILSMSQEGEIVTTCSVCKHFLKFPSNTSLEDFQANLEKHEETNKDQVTIASIEKKLTEFADGEIEVEDEVQEALNEATKNDE